MVIDLTGNSNLDASLLGFDASVIVKKSVSKLKRDFGIFDKERPLEDAKEELDNLIKAKVDLDAKVIEAIKNKDRNALEKASKNLQILNKSIYLVQNEVDYKTKIEYIKSSAISKAPSDSISKEVIDKAEESVKKIEEDVEEKKELDGLLDTISSNTENVLTKGKSKISDIIDNPKDYLTTKNLITVSFLGLAFYGFIKLIK